MPYISKEDREHLDYSFNDMFNHDFDNTGTLGFEQMLSAIIKNVPSGKVKGAFNYFVTRLFCHVFEADKCSGYTDLSNAIAVMGDMEHELRRRLLDKYEDKVIKQNGDVPELEAFML